jgi:hypothetical protein
MAEFADLPDPGTVAQQDGISRERWRRFIVGCEPLFIEIAEKLRDLEPPAVITVSEEKVIERHWFFGETERVIVVTKRGWEIGFTSDAEYPTRAYLLPNGSVYPDTAAGIQALLFRELGSSVSVSVENPSAALNARARIIEGLKRQPRALE